MIRISHFRRLCEILLKSIHPVTNAGWGGDNRREPKNPRYRKTTCIYYSTFSDNDYRVAAPFELYPTVTGITIPSLK